MIALFSDRVRVLRAALVDDGPYGKRRDWSTPRVVYDGPGNAQPNRTFGSRSPERETAQQRILVYLPVGADVEATDRIEVLGDVYKVDGYPQTWPHLTLGHVLVRAWKGVH